jgi:meso-butanediol dehydrogenase/(S,S)-butanediol dehydrogenase/diacetyl reductase
MYNLDGQVAIVTGAGSGLGRAIALRLSKEGAQIPLRVYSR